MEQNIFWSVFFIINSYLEISEDKILIVFLDLTLCEKINCCKFQHFNAENISVDVLSKCGCISNTCFIR